MGENAELMLTGKLCCECGVVLNDECHTAEVPVRCDRCHYDTNTPIYDSYHGIYSETGIRVRFKSEEPYRALEPMIAYYLETEYSKNKKLFNKNYRNVLIQVIAELMDTSIGSMLDD